VGQPSKEHALAPVRLGKYQLVRNLAVGGMAEVFLARASGIEGFEKLVVVKRILPTLAASDDFVRMFLDEARLAAQLHHPNIAQVYDIGLDAGAHFFVMEYLDGHDVRAVLSASTKTGGLPLEHALTIATSVAAGLHHAHEHRGPDGKSLGIVHRDVSPTNVLVTFAGAVKLVDFGVAKARTRAETRDGALKGKLRYMSPEQCRAEPLDRRSDIYSLGLLLYELTAGSRAFDEELEYKLMNLVAAGSVPPPSSRVRAYPKELEAIVMKALRPNPAERYATAEEMQLELERYAARARLTLSTVGLRRFMAAAFPKDRPPRRPSSEVSAIGGEIEIEAELPEDSVATPRRSRRWLVAMSLAGLVIIGGAIALFSTGSPSRRAAASEPPPQPPPPVIVPVPVVPPPPAAAAVVPPAPAVAAAPDAGVAPPKKSRKKARAKWDPDSPFLPSAESK
jgi:serine/threonine protein kinase